jgi:hypothetical protein
MHVRLPSGVPGREILHMQMQICALFTTALPVTREPRGQDDQ